MIDLLSKDNALFEKAFDVLNRVYFNAELPKVMITIPVSYQDQKHTVILLVTKCGQTQTVPITKSILQQNI